MTDQVKNPKKAIALISGGLDSMLAARVMLDQGIHVEGINFYTGFCVEGHTHAIRRQDRDRKKRNNALWVAEQLGIKLHIVDVVEAYQDIVLNPRHGYGANLNPCLDCKVFMVKQARDWMDAHGFDFIITGEVIGQRPKSQRRETMPLIAKQSTAEDRLLRPLCAKSLPPTLPEREGWVDREQLFQFSGRSRKPQMALAEKFGIDEYSQPAGGCCFLTNTQYSAKFADLLTHRTERRYTLDDIMLLKVGRHLRPNPRFKMIIGREEGENNFLDGYRKQFTHLRSTSHLGPLILLDGAPNEADIQLAARIAARFTQGRDAASVQFELKYVGQARQSLDVTPMPVESIEASWYLDQRKDLIQPLHQRPSKRARRALDIDIVSE